VDRVQMTNADITRTFLFILILAGLITASLWTLSPFLSALLWATTIVVATWPLMLQVERLLGGRRALAVVVMTLVIAAVFVVPFGMAIVKTSSWPSKAVGQVPRNGLDLIASKSVLPMAVRRTSIDSAVTWLIWMASGSVWWTRPSASIATT